MSDKVNSIHCAIGFGLLFLVPIAEKIDDDFGDLASFLCILYWGAVTCVGLFIGIKGAIKSEGFLRFVFLVWFYVSGLAGLVGAYAILMKGLSHASPWAYVLLVYGVAVILVFKDLAE